MKKTLLISLIYASIVLINTSCQQSLADKKTSDPTDVDPQLMSSGRPLTFVGTRAGEGYFSADGQKMIFQSEREKGNPFYQIYLMDLNSGKTDLLSTGSGKTTCAWVKSSMTVLIIS
jgi:hypothetical protein